MLQAGKERMIYMKTSLYFFSKTTLENSIRIIITIIQEMWDDLPAINLIYFSFLSGDNGPYSMVRICMCILQEQDLTAEYQQIASPC